LASWRTCPWKPSNRPKAPANSENHDLAEASAYGTSCANYGSRARDASGTPPVLHARCAAQVAVRPVLAQFSRAAMRRRFSRERSGGGRTAAGGRPQPLEDPHVLVLLGMPLHAKRERVPG